MQLQMLISARCPSIVTTGKSKPTSLPRCARHSRLLQANCAAFRRTAVSTSDVATYNALPRNLSCRAAEADVEAEPESDEGVEKNAPGQVLTALAEQASKNPDLTIFAELLAETKLTCSGEGPLTVIAPTNAAFEAFFEERKISKIQLLEFEGLPEILMYHMLEGSLAYDDFKDGTELSTMQGRPLDTSIVGYSDVKMNGAAVTKAEVAGDALFHQVDTVLVPPYVMWTKVIDPKEILSLEGWAPEVINGRIAMVGFVLAFFGELNTGDAFTTQLFSHFGEFLKCATLWTAASFAPSFQNRMGYCGDPKTLATNSSWQTAIKGGPIPDYVEPYFTPDVELLNGRVAMVGIALMIVIETIKGSALF